jgi:hypothetical protein
LPAPALGEPTGLSILPASEELVGRSVERSRLAPLPVLF